MDLTNPHNKTDLDVFGEFGESKTTNRPPQTGLVHSPLLHPPSTRVEAASRRRHASRWVDIAFKIEDHPVVTKKLLVTSASLLVTSALLVVRSY